MPRAFRYKAKFRCRKCGRRTEKMGSCEPRTCSCGAGKGHFELLEKIDLKEK